jgi:hypothetical protein
MWVRIREISFPVDQTDRVIAHVRDTTVARYPGEAYRGSRLLVDRPNGAALEVSYWQSEQGARDDGAPLGGVIGLGPASDQQAWPIDPTGVPGGSVVRTRYYELGIDAG